MFLILLVLCCSDWINQTNVSKHFFIRGALTISGTISSLPEYENAEVMIQKYIYIYTYNIYKIY